MNGYTDLLLDACNAKLNMPINATESRHLRKVALPYKRPHPIALRILHCDYLNVAGSHPGCIKFSGMHGKLW